MFTELPSEKPSKSKGRGRKDYISDSGESGPEDVEQGGEGRAEPKKRRARSKERKDRKVNMFVFLALNIVCSYSDDRDYIKTLKNCHCLLGCQ